MRGEVYALAGLKGHESSGERFAVMLQSDELLLPTLLVVPTSNTAKSTSFRPVVTVGGSRTVVLTEQTTTIDATRLGRRVGRLTQGEMQAVDEALRLVLELD